MATACPLMLKTPLCRSRYRCLTSLNITQMISDNQITVIVINIIGVATERTNAPLY